MGTFKEKTKLVIILFKRLVQRTIIPEVKRKPGDFRGLKSSIFFWGGEGGVGGMVRPGYLQSPLLFDQRFRDLLMRA